MSEATKPTAADRAIAAGWVRRVNATGHAAWVRRGHLIDDLAWQSESRTLGPCWYAPETPRLWYATEDEAIIAAVAMRGLA